MNIFSGRPFVVNLPNRVHPSSEIAEYYPLHQKNQSPFGTAEITGFLHCSFLPPCLLAVRKIGRFGFGLAAGGGNSSPLVVGSRIKLGRFAARPPYRAI